MLNVSLDYEVLWFFIILVLFFQVLEFFHFACTSEDINNLAHALSLKESLNDIIFPVMVDLCKEICTLAKENAHIPMLSRTHGQVPHLF